MVKTLKDRLRCWAPKVLAGALLSFTAFSIYRDSMVREEFNERAKDADSTAMIFAGRNPFNLAGFDYDGDGKFDEILHYRTGMSSSVNVIRADDPYFKSYSEALRSHNK